MVAPTGWSVGSVGNAFMHSAGSVFQYGGTDESVPYVYGRKVGGRFMNRPYGNEGRLTLKTTGDIIISYQERLYLRAIGARGPAFRSWFFILAWRNG